MQCVGVSWQMWRGSLADKLMSEQFPESGKCESPTDLIYREQANMKLLTDTDGEEGGVERERDVWI